ncbi:MAG: lipoprotein signal peptidase [Prevotella sp.]
MTQRKAFFSDGVLASILIVLLLVIDQIIKIEVKTNMCIGDSIRITDWFYIEFIENKGMAYGMTFINKVVLSLLRIVAVGCIGYYIHTLIRQSYRRGYVLCLSMILAGAAGNIIDSMFYGLVFSPSTMYNLSEWVPFGQGYAPFLQGKVVDMFYFPLIVTTWPQWVPFWGGEEFIFFSPIFNFADACISVGVVVLLLFYHKDLETLNTVFCRKKKPETETPADDKANG